MFKKNPNRPPITISLKKVNTGYKVLPNDSFNTFSFKRITRAIFRHDLYNQNCKGPEISMNGIAGNSTIIQPPSHVTIPLSARWFDFDTIHEIERQTFPEFFMQEDEPGRLFKKTPKLYKFYRNYIIHLWRQNSKKYLSPSLCRRNLPGDVSAIIRIHAFLQHWGLINFPSKQHTKQYIEAQPYNYCCHVCQETNAPEYYICKIDEDVHFNTCNCCYATGIYPQVLTNCHFVKVIPEVHDEVRKKRMTPDEVQKMLEVFAGEGQRERDLWTLLAKAFPNYSKEEIMINFLQIPHYHKMNSNIFHNNEDFIMEKQPPIEEQPTVFEDFQNQQQLSIALSYYAYKTDPEKYPELSLLFTQAEKHSRYLASEQHEKCIKILRMLIDFEQSKLELKSLFIEEMGKLVKGEIKTLHNVAINSIAEEMKNHAMDIE